MHRKNRTELARELGIGRVTLWRYEQASVIPAELPVSANRSVYSPVAERAIRNFVEAQR